MSGVEFGSITARADKVIIVGSGPSAESFPFHLIPADVHVIAVKGAGHFVPRYDTWFTCDVNTRCLPFLEHPRAGVDYVAAVPDEFGTPLAERPLHRIAYPGVHYLHRVRPERHELCEDPACATTGNSAYGALNLAYHMGAKRVLLVGVDGTKDGYAFLKGKPLGDLGHLPWLFSRALPQLAARRTQVATVGLQSHVKCFPKLHADEALQWLGRPTKALILGSANCVWQDMERALDLAEFDGVIVVKRTGEKWPTHADAWITLHPESIGQSIRRRQQAGFPPILRVFAQKEGSKRSGITDVMAYSFEHQINSGSSGLFAVKVALEVFKYDKLVLCGMPLETGQGRLDGLTLWRGSKSFIRGFQESMPHIGDRVRSMSGKTKELLGAPTVEWLTE